MRLRSGLPICAAALVLGMPSTAAADTLVYEIVSGWTVHTDRSRAFSCFMEAQYEGSSTIRVGFDESGERLHMIVADSAWDGIEPGAEYAVEISFGDAPSWDGRASGYAIGGEPPRTGLRYEVDNAGRSAFVEQLMKEYSVDVAYGGRDAVSLSLAGSYRAALKLTECQEAMADVRNAARADSSGARVSARD